jgi:hypothetical protein
MTGLLFDKLPRSRPPRRLMKVQDVREYGSVILMRCKRGHEIEVPCVPDDDHRTLPSQYTPSELKRGLPCERCAELALSSGGKK